MIFDRDSDSDSGGESDNAKPKTTQPSLPVGSRSIPFPVVQNIQQQIARERDRPYKLNSPPLTSSVQNGLERSPSLPLQGAPRVNVEEVDGAPEIAIASGKHHRPASGNGRAQRGHVKAPSADWSVDLALARRGSPSDFSYDSDSSESTFPVPSHLPARTRVRTETMDSDTVLLTMSRDAMPMMRTGSELSDTGSLIVPPTTRGMPYSDDSTEEGGDNDHEKKLLYLMVARCIAYPFNAKYQLETAPPKPKLNEERFQNIVQILDVCRDQDWEKFTPSSLSLNGGETKCLRSEKFLNCLDWYMDNVLGRDDVVTMSKNGSFSVKELESIFKVLATKHIMYTSKELDVDNSELQMWCGTFRKLVEHGARGTRSGYSGARGVSPNENSGTGPNREKLYKLFQKILNIKSIEHQILYRVCQVSCAGVI